MLGIKVDKSENKLVKRWQFTKVVVPFADIVEVAFDPTYAGSDKTAIRIGIPYGATNRLLIRTKITNYILFTTNAEFLEIKSILL
ncbi:hypothetical protein MHH52_15375 [Paenibacillus sp. FSL K6-0276]|uniref:SunI/YnzG family protein n=1 Tax=Paenibacillus sp. FSL K6-0276 TaxID=2921450 RepID=UPI0030EC9729